MDRQVTKTVLAAAMVVLVTATSNLAMAADDPENVVEVKTVEELKAALAVAAKDSTIKLADNTYEIDETLYVTNGMTLVGADRSTCVLKCVTKNLRPLVYLAQGAIANLTVTGVSCTDTWKNGGGVLVASPGGEIEGCAVINNELKGANCSGAGIHSSAKVIVSNSVISNNVCGTTTSGSGGGLTCSSKAAADSLLCNCLIADNFAANAGGGILFSLIDGVKVVNCTFAGNSTMSEAGAFHINNANYECFVNCVFARNSLSSGGPCWSGYNTKDQYRAYSTHNCFDGDYATFGDSPTQGTVLFADAANGDYHLVLQDCARGAGIKTDDTPTTDLDGVPLADPPDAGCFQYVMPTVFSCSGAFGPQKAFPDVAITFEGMAENAPDGAELSYAWALVDSTFRTNVIEGETIATPIGTPGVYSVSLSVTATMPGERPQTVFCALPERLEIYARTNYVTCAKTDSASFPYDRPDIAATNWFDLVGGLLDGSTVVFDEGVHQLTGVVSVDGRWTVVGQGIDRTVLQAAYHQCCVSVNAAGAKVSGMTFRGGWVGNWQKGGSVYIGSRGGTVENCRMVGGECPKGQINAFDAGVHVAGDGSVVNCIIDHNTNGVNASSSAAVTLAGAGTLRNCLIWKNVQGSTESNVGVIHASAKATVENCTVVGNFSESTASNFVALLLNGTATVRNNIFAQNASVDTLADSSLAGVPNWRMAGAGYDVNVTNNIFSGSKNLGAGCLDATKLIFRSPEEGNFRQRVTSSGVDSGVLQPWMSGSVDLVGASRVYGKRPDLGCYECQTGYGLMLLVK